MARAAFHFVLIVIGAMLTLFPRAVLWAQAPAITIELVLLQFSWC